MDHLCYLCLMFVMLSCLFIATLWSPEGKGLTSWLLFCVVYCDFVTFQFCILGQVWYMIFFIPDPCCLSYLCSRIGIQLTSECPPPDYNYLFFKEACVLKHSIDSYKRVNFISIW